MSCAAFVGAYENICAYRLVGFKTVEVKNEAEAKDAISKLLVEDTAVIFVDEEFFGNSCDTFNNKNIPIVSIPFAGKGESGGIKRLREKVVKATGSEMIFGKD